MIISRNPHRPLAHPERRAVMTGLGLALISGPASARRLRDRVLFVCPAGSVKSAIAREILKRRAADEGVDILVSSRGVHPEDHVSPVLAANLNREGINPAAAPLRRLTQSDVDRADIIVAFDSASEEPMLRSARAWKSPSWNSDYAAAKADLDHRLTGLIAELRTRAAQPGRTRRR